MNQNSYNTAMREDNQLIVITHLCQLLTYVTGFGGLIVPLVIWATQKDNVYQMNEHGKQIVNFQLSIIIYAIMCIPLIFLFGLGVLLLIGLGLIAFVYPIINAIKASHREPTKYPLSLNFIS
jgi:uncharacterized Tic20 family protein